MDVFRPLRPLAVVFMLMFVPAALAQTESGGSVRWRPPGVLPTTPASNQLVQETPTSAATLDPAGAQQRPPAAAVSAGTGTLPREHGQVWREYDISPYTSRVAGVARPEQAVIDWILRETGTEIWFAEPLGILSAGRDTLRVYHTPDMQRVVADVVDRFVASRAESHVLSLRLVTIGSPNWRTTAWPLLRRVDVQTPGVDAWLISKENAAVLLGELRKRSDFQEHNSPNLVINNGQSYSISRMRPRSYIRGIRLRENVWPGHELEMGQVEEGYSLELSPLFSHDGGTIDAVIKAEVHQIEKLVGVNVDVPTANGQRQRVQIQVPQVAGWRLHERFRWPEDQLLIISAGVGAAPAAKTNTLGIALPLNMGPPRADALLFIESKGKASQALLDDQRSARTGDQTYRGRY